MTANTLQKTAMSMRLDHRPGEVIDRGREFTFSWNGEEYPAYGRDTIISALAACSQRRDDGVPPISGVFFAVPRERELSPAVDDLTRPGAQAHGHDGLLYRRRRQ